MVRDRARLPPAIRSSLMSGAGAVMGVSDHFARPELVTLVLEGGAPVFVNRRRVELIDQSLPTAPYHPEAPALDAG